MKNRNFLKLFIMAFAMASAFALTSCGDDDPVPSPTPDPTPDPDPTPTVSYYGYGCAFTMDSIAGDAEAFLTVLRDTMELYCPELTAVSDYQYTVSIVCEEGDTAQIRELRTKYNAFVSAIYMYRDSERVPVVSANVFSKQVTEHNVQKDWTFNANGNASSSLEFFFQVPSLRNTLWGTDDAKQPSLGAFRFGSIWNQSSLKATGTATAHADNGEYTAYRQGNLLVFLDEAGANKYGFQINESEESEPMTMTLVSVDGQNLDEADRVTYTIDN